MELVRAAALTGYFTVARRVGLDPAPLLRRVGLTRAMLANAEAMLPARAVVQLLEDSAAAARCPSLGLQMAECRNLADMGMISLLVAHQPTLRDALAILTRYRNRINSTLVLQIDEAGDTVVLRENFAQREAAASRQAADLALGVLARICAAVLGPQWTPDHVCLDYPAPPPGERDIYRRVFACPAIFGADFSGIVVARAALDAANPRADAALASHARTLVDAIMEPAERTIVQEVEASILLLLPSGRASITASAAALGMTPRTLQRRLDAEGASFTALLERVRSRLAQSYMRNSRLRLTDVAALLGYSSLGAFTRWYAQAFGDAPSRLRRKAALRLAP